MALIFFSITSFLLSIGGYFEQKIAEGPSALTLVLIISITLLGILAGFAVGHYTPNKYGLIIMCLCNACVVSMLIFSFLISFTGTWVVLLVIGVFLSLICIYLPLKW